MIYAWSKGAAVTLLNRTPERAMALADDPARAPRGAGGVPSLVCGPAYPGDGSRGRVDADLVVNTTPLGMSPHEDGNPWPSGVAFPGGPWPTI